MTHRYKRYQAPNIQVTTFVGIVLVLLGAPSLIVCLVMASSLGFDVILAALACAVGAVLLLATIAEPPT